MKRIIVATLIVSALSGCCTGSYSNRSTWTPPDFIIRYPSSIGLPNETGAKVRIPLTFTNSAERTICLGKPRGKNGWSCGYKPELHIRQPGTGPALVVSTEVSGLLGERIKRGRDARTEGLAYAELTLQGQLPTDTTVDVCLEVLLRDDKGVATLVSRAGGPVRILIGSDLSAPTLDQPSEMSDKPIDCGFGAMEAEQ